MLEQLRQAVPGDHRGLGLPRLRRELHTPRRVRFQIPELNRRFENPGEQHPCVAHGLPPRFVPELVGHPPLDCQTVDIAQPPLLPLRSTCTANTVLYPCCVDGLNVGKTSGCHCVSVNVPNVTNAPSLLAQRRVERRRLRVEAAADRHHACRPDIALVSVPSACSGGSSGGEQQGEKAGFIDIPHRSFETVSPRHCGEGRQTKRAVRRASPARVT